MQNTGTFYPGQSCFVRNLGWGRIPSVPDKSNRNLGSISYSAQILICFIAYIFYFLKSSLGGVGALQLWNGYVAFHTIVIVVRMSEAPSKDNEISQHPLLGGQALRFCWDYHTERIAKLTDKMYKINNHVRIINPGIKWREFLLISVSSFSAFNSSSQSDVKSLSATRSRQTGLMHSSLKVLKLEFESIFHTVKHGNGEDRNVDVVPKWHILWSQCS